MAKKHPDAVFDERGTTKKISKTLHQSLKTVKPSDLQDKPVPERNWIVPEWIPMHHVTALYGDGGTGKSLLAMQLITCADIQRQWLGQSVANVRTLGFFCEDTNDELHRRQASINRAYGCDFSDLKNTCWVSGVGEDNILMEFGDGNQGRLTLLYERLRQAVCDFGARFVVIDTAADTFGGNEINRGQVRQFINALNKLALEIDGAVLLCAHPSLSGMSSRRGDGGNTAWSNTVRSRLYLEYPEKQEGQDNPDARILSRKKANYARVGDELPLIWQEGMFTLQPAAGNFGLVGSIEKKNRENQTEEAFLKAIDDFEIQGRNLSASNRSGNYAPKLMLTNSHTKGFNKKELTDAMHRLFDAKIIRNELYGRPSNQVAKIVKSQVSNSDVTV